MAHKAHAEDDLSHGGDRPWVYFMIDAFFLCTQFFVVSFRVRTDEVMLPQRLPPGGTAQARTVAVDARRKLSVHVSRMGGQPVYQFMTRETNLSGFNDMLASSAQAGVEYQVRVSYEPEVPFQDVLHVFNACAKVKISECGLVPLRGRDAVQ